MAITEQNFAIAWKKLLDQYDNNKMIIYGHVNFILSAKPVVKESSLPQEAGKRKRVHQLILLLLKE